jgi:branched-chain amino acid transport system ATP-binding protein
MLEIRDLSVHYDGVAAVERASLDVRQGEIVAVLGVNGAGKTTLLRALMNLVPRSGGTIVLGGTDVSALSTEDLVERGLSLVTEGRELFPAMTCRDNLRCALLLRRDRVAFEEQAEPVFALFPRLRERLHQRAGTLSGGEQQMLAIGRALMQNPSVLLLDEPSFGLSPALTEDLFETILSIRASGRTVLLVEQKARMALEISDRAYVLTVGRITRGGPVAELREDEMVRKLYLGG